MFNLPAFVSKPKAPVVIRDGKKAAEAAAAIFPYSMTTTSSGGAGAAAKSDWTPLADRSILIWPDHDPAGEKYAREVATILAGLDCSVAIIDAAALAAIDPAGGAHEPRDKRDAADALAEWPDLEALRKTVAELRKSFDPGPDPRRRRQRRPRRRRLQLPPAPRLARRPLACLHYGRPRHRPCRSNPSAKPPLKLIDPQRPAERRVLHSRLITCTFS